MMTIGALFVIVYTFVGGFIAESASDFMQGIVMFFALIAVPSAGISAAGDIFAVIDSVKQIPGFFEFFGIAQPILKEGT